MVSLVPCGEVEPVSQGQFFVLNDKDPLFLPVWNLDDYFLAEEFTPGIDGFPWTTSVNYGYQPSQVAVCTD